MPTKQLNESLRDLSDEEETYQTVMDVLTGAPRGSAQRPEDRPQPPTSRTYATPTRDFLSSFNHDYDQQRRFAPAQVGVLDTSQRDNFLLNEDDTYFGNVNSCEPPFATYFPAMACDVNFNMLYSTVSLFDSDVLVWEEEETDPPSGFLNTINEDAFDAYYADMLISSDFYSDFMDPELSAYTDEDGVCGVYVEGVLETQEDYDPFGVFSLNATYQPFYSEVSPSGADISLTYRDLVIDAPYIYGDDYTAPYEAPLITLNGKYRMALQENERRALLDRYSNPYSNYGDMIDNFHETVYNSFASAPFTDKDLIFRIENDTFKFGVYNTINVDTTPGPTVGPVFGAHSLVAGRIRITSPAGFDAEEDIEVLGPITP